jgi:hypothetical protein
MSTTPKTPRDHDIPAAETSPSVEAASPGVQRRDLVSALLGVVGVGAAAAALASCARQDGDEAEDLPRLGQALQAQIEGGVVVVDTVLGTVPTTPPTPRTGDLATKSSAALNNATVAIALGCVNNSDGGGGIFAWSGTTNITDDGGTHIVPGGAGTGPGWVRMYDGPLDVRWFGARGDNTIDDTSAIQNTLNAAATSGSSVFLPPGVYKVQPPAGSTSALSIRFFGTGLNLTGSISGAGEATQIAGYNIPNGHAVLEVLGDGNSTSGNPSYWLTAANIAIRNLSIYQGSGCGVQSFCLRVGDANTGVLVERLFCQGANGVAIRMSAHNNGVGATQIGNGFAQINTVFRQCLIETTFAPGSFAVYPENASYQDLGTTGGPPAFWDNVRFESCELNGLVSVMGTLAAFESCTFSGNSNLGSRYGCNVEVVAGSASFNSCYFEDAYANIHVCPGATMPIFAGYAWNGGVLASDVGRVSATNCFFSGEVDFSEPAATYAVWSDPQGSTSIGTIELVSCVFADYNYVGASIANASANLRNVRLVDPVNLKIVDNNNTQQIQAAPIKILGMAANFCGSNTETVRWQVPALPSAPLVPVYYSSPYVTSMVVAGTNKVYTFRVSRTCWITRIKLMIDVQVSTLTPNTLQVGVNQNGISVVNLTWGNFTDHHEDTFSHVSSGWSANPAPGVMFTAGQDIAIFLNNAWGVANGTQCVVELELAY